ncbi:MAG TPA: ArsA family ATPase [Bacteroidetes bacterium]|nr:ArsA family ATPase [Bacteroidota bacterium]
MDKTTKNIFFLGKGGVGKSTSSALTALHLAEKGKKVQLVSLDPAHNQSDIFEKKFSEKATRINSNLTVKEVEINLWVKKYLKDIQFQVKRSYSYLTAFNLENYLDIIKYSPGIEEYALLMAYKDIRKKAKNTDYIIFDMPPTALTLKFLTLPHLSLLWLDNLLALRSKIIEKREIITRVRLGKKEIETDKIRNKLNQQIKEYREIKTVFEDPEKTSLNLVLNTDKLSFSESELIVANLSRFNMTIQNLFLNKYHDGFDKTALEEKYKNCRIQVLKNSDQALIGIPVLLDYLHRLPAFIEM